MSLKRETLTADEKPHFGLSDKITKEDIKVNKEGLLYIDHLDI